VLPLDRRVVGALRVAAAHGEVLQRQIRAADEAPVRAMAAAGPKSAELGPLAVDDQPVAAGERDVPSCP
jgi:hypothetical protein